MNIQGASYLMALSINRTVESKYASRMCICRQQQIDVAFGLMFVVKHQMRTDVLTF